MPATIEWVMLAYRMPREPSTPRIAVWRKLRQLGALQVVDNLVALPADARTKEQLGWVADQILEGGGEATIFVGQAGSRAQELPLVERMSAAVAKEYEAIRVEAEELRAAGSADPRTLGRLRRELRRIGTRDFFPPPEREAAQQAVEALGLGQEEPAS